MKRIIFVLSLLICAQAAAASPTKGALNFLESRHEQVNSILRQAETPQRDEKLTKLLKDFLDYEAIARMSLDREWNKRSTTDRARFTSLLRQLVERQYQNNMERTLDYKVRYIEGEKTPEGELVRTLARSKKSRRSPELEIAYSMRAAGNDWRITDIRTDGVSLVTNYQRQFRRIISKEGWNGLISRMQKKLASKETF